MTTTENLRRETRVDVRVPVVLYRAKVAVTLETSDVSFKGLFVCTADPPPLRSLVRLKVALVDRELEAHAMAVHVVAPSDGAEAGAVRAPGVGLQFWGLAGPDRVAWDDFVAGLVQARRIKAKAPPPPPPPPLEGPPSVHPPTTEPGAPRPSRAPSK
jgi:hypothetical protein